MRELLRIESGNLRLKLKDWYMASERRTDKKIKLPDIVSISAEPNSSNIILVDKINNFVIKCNFEDYSGSLLFVLKSSHLRIETGELLQRSYGLSNAKSFAIIVSEAETWNFNLRNVYLYVLTSKVATSCISFLDFHKKVRIIRNFLFTPVTRSQLTELPSGNFLLGLTGSSELFKICIDSNDNMRFDRTIRLNDLFQCMAICHVATYSYLIVSLSNCIITVFRIEEKDELIHVVSNPHTNISNVSTVSTLLWCPSNKYLLLKNSGEPSFRVWNVTNSGGLILLNHVINQQSDENSLLEAKAFALRNGQLLVFNSQKDNEALSIYQIKF